MAIPIRPITQPNPRKCAVKMVAPSSMGGSKWIQFCIPVVPIHITPRPVSILSMGKQSWCGLGDHSGLGVGKDFDLSLILDCLINLQFFFVCSGEGRAYWAGLCSVFILDYFWFLAWRVTSVSVYLTWTRSCSMVYSNCMNVYTSWLHSLFSSSPLLSYSTRIADYAKF